MSKDKDLNNEVNEEGLQEESTQNVEQGSEEKEQEVPVELSWEEKHAELNDKFLRLYSEFDNYRKRTNKEKLDLISTANSGVLKDLLPVLDDFERAIASNEQSEDATTLKEGFELIHTKLKSALESKGLKQMEAKGVDFDSEIHEAIANIPAPSKDLKGKVIEDVEKGYFLNDKVVRYAKVVVGQ